jgi:hypothetical protein
VNLEEVIAVLHALIGTEIEVSAHGGRGNAPTLAVSSRGRLRTGDVLSRPGAPEIFLFVLVDDAGFQVGSFTLYAESYGGGGWLDGKEEVLEVESGVVRLMIVSAEDDDDLTE